MAVEFTLDADDVTAARLLAIGIRPRRELAAFGLVVSALLALSVTSLRFTGLPVVIGLTACLGAFRVMQIGKLKDAAIAALQRNPTLRKSVSATWNADGVIIAPLLSVAEKIPWGELLPLRENARVFLLLQKNGSIHAIPKRAFEDKIQLMGFRRLANSAAALARRHDP